MARPSSKSRKGKSKAKPSDQTPLMRQYLGWKARYPDAILFFRLGDFYEMFYEDAVVASRALDLVLTTRDKGKENPVPMCGVPHHAGRGYIARLVELGHKVAVCEQVEDPRKSRGIVKREVTEVITPGVILDPEHLEAKRSNFLLALVLGEDDGEQTRVGCAFCDASTGEFSAAELIGFDAVQDELARIGPRQLLLDPEQADPLLARLPGLASYPYERAAELFGAAEADAALIAEATTGEGLPELEAAVQVGRACAAVLRYLRSMFPGRELPPFRIVPYTPGAHVVLDEATLANLEIFESLMERGRRGTLLDAVDDTATAMGGRLLRRTLAFPLREVAGIRRRQDAVAYLIEHPTLRAELRRLLAQFRDLERLGRRVACLVATPKDLGLLGRSLGLMPELVALLAGDEAALEAPPELLAPPEDTLGDVQQTLGDALVDEPPFSSREGGIFRRGYHGRLDELVALGQGGKDEILAMEQRERERTGISSLKIKYNKVFGYTLEVSRAKAAQVPEDYVRKQTLANVERYVTTELSEHEARVLSAEEKRLDLEERLFDALRERLSREEARLRNLAHVIARIDLLAGFAEVSARHDYVRPEVDDGERIEIGDGRHPVIERLVGPGRFVANDTTLSDAEQLLIVTGPNMAGKSTIIRQVALITLMAQIGCFVPARLARIGLVDRIFTRVGASDNLARGQSTFMVEMSETANILRYATRRSLVVLDEIGRGTSTYDGVSIAWAVAEFIHDRIKAKTLFATHFHELCGLAEIKPRVQNRQVAVREYKSEVVFLHKLIPGGTSRSHGIQVAKLAGLPLEVIERARLILQHLEQGGGQAGHGLPAMGPQLSLFTGSAPAPEPAPPATPDAVARLLEGVDADKLTPREAHALLYELMEANKDRETD